MISKRWISMAAVLAVATVSGRAQDPATRAERLAELSDPERLYARGGPRIHEGELLGAIRIPIGGVGTGCIQMDGQGRRAAWQLWRNFSDFPLPHSLFAVRAATGDGPAVVRVLQTVAEGPLPAMESLRFRGEYPFGWYEFVDAELPVEVQLEVFNPLIPLDAKSSAIPCAIFNLTATNRGEREAAVSFLATQQNAAGLVDEMPPKPPEIRRRVERRTPSEWRVQGRKSDQYGGNRNAVVRDDGATYLHMTRPRPEDAPDRGDLVLLALEPDARATASWEDLGTLCAEFARSGSVSGPDEAGPSPAGETLDGALATPFVLRPGETRTVSFVLAWHFPNIPMIRDERRPLWKHDGYVYAQWWSDASAVARHVVEHLDELTEQTRRYHESFYESNLPHWLLDRIGSQVAIMRSPTCFWARDGHFGCWEGCSWTFGSCAGNATHVWGYAQAVTRVFPELGRKMREHEHGNQTPEGMLPVRLGFPPEQNYPAFDGQCHSILGTYLGHLLSADGAWLDRAWPEVRQSANYLIGRWDDDEDGMLSGPQHGMDSDHGGTSSWMGSMYLSALAAAERMARLQGDDAAAARYGAIVRVGAENQDEALFNGEYFIQIPDAKPRKDYLTGCYTDQMLGQWWAHLVDLGWIWPREHVRAAMRALYDYNFRTDFHGFEQSPRKFVADDEAAMVQCTWPRGGRPEPRYTMLHADEVKVGISYSVAALMVYCGLLDEAFTVVRANHDRYDGRLRTGLDDTPWSGLGISGNPFGDDCAGKFYVRALSVWSMLVACQGQIVDGPRGVLGFDPAWRPDDHASFFTSAEGWGVFTQRRAGAVQHDAIELRWGKLRLRELVFGLPEGARVEGLRVRSSGADLAASHALAGSRLRVVLGDAVTLGPGDDLVVSIELDRE